MKLEIPPNIAVFLKSAQSKSKAVIKPLKKRAFFIYVLLLLAALGISIYLVSILFGYEDTAYREQKQAETVNISINQDKAVIDKVLQLNTADSGPISQDYVPGRDNPFAE